MTSRIAVLTSVLLLGALWPNASCAEDNNQLMEWFASLGLKEATGPYVVVLVSARDSTGRRICISQYDHGFLFGEGKDSFDILTPRLRIVSYSKTSNSVRAPFARYWRVPDRCVVSTVASLAESQSERYSTYSTLDAELPRKRSWYIDPVVAIVSMAFQLRQQGETGRASELLKAAEKMLVKLEGWEHESDIGGKFEEYVRWNFCFAMKDSLIYGFRNKPWKALLAECKLLRKRFSSVMYTDELDQLKEMEQILSSMVKATGSAPVSSQDGGTTEGSGVEQLIYGLREQRGVAVDLLHREKATLRGNPADELYRIGMPVVPQLIEAIDDIHFCRITGRFSHDDPERRPLTIGYCAYDIATRIIVSTYGDESIPIIQNIDTLTKAERTELKKKLSSRLEELRANSEE